MSKLTIGKVFLISPLFLVLAQTSFAGLSSESGLSQFEGTYESSGAGYDPTSEHCPETVLIEVRPVGNYSSELIFISKDYSGKEIRIDRVNSNTVRFHPSSSFHNATAAFGSSYYFGGFQGTLTIWTVPDESKRVLRQMHFEQHQGLSHLYCNYDG